MPTADSEESLAELARLLTVIEASGDLLYDWDLTSDRLVWTGATPRLFGESKTGFPEVGEAFQGRIHPEDLPHCVSARVDHISGLGEYDCEYRVRRADGRFQWVHDRGTVKRAANGTPNRMVGVLRLVTRRKQHEAKLEYLAGFDDLTGQFNKLRIREALDQALSEGESGQAGAFLTIGLDRMGLINAVYGHEAGDRVIFEIAQRLEREFGEGGVIGRLDSDRFGVVLTECTEEQALEISERLLHAIRHYPVEIGSRAVHVSASAGLVLYPAQGDASFDIITKGDAALLRAKTAARDGVALYELTEAQRQDQLDHMNVGEEVKLALKEDRLAFAYQPLVDAETGEIRCYECLLRMRSPSGDTVPAHRFVPVVESLGLVRTIDRRALELVFRDLESHPDIELALNISGLTATDRSWLRLLKSRLKERPDLARRLIVEITETAALQDIEESASFVSIIRQLGCRVAIDDFGAGYTTFRYLKALTVDLVKIDGSFTRDIDASSENQLFIRNLLDLARGFGLLTVAECVERPEEAAYLRREGVDLLQGHLFGMPLDALPQPGASPRYSPQEVEAQGMRSNVG